MGSPITMVCVEHNSTLLALHTHALCHMADKMQRAGFLVGGTELRTVSAAVDEQNRVELVSGEHRCRFSVKTLLSAWCYFNVEVANTALVMQAFKI